MAAARRLATEEQRRRSEAMAVHDEGHGIDVFGADPSWIDVGFAVTNGLYDRWFRVESRGHERVPDRGPVIVAANHSGTLPFDALMLWADLARHTDPPRLPRSVTDHFVGNLPFVSTLFARCGALGGSRHNLEYALEQGELVVVFPEGTPGIGKPFRDRYQLQTWRVGHVEMALRHRAPVVPAAVVGAEEQMPQLARLPIRAFGSPYVPLTLVPFPLPVRYHIRYGEPLYLHERFAPEQASEPEVLQQAANLVSGRVARLIEEGLAEREGVFR